MALQLHGQPGRHARRAGGAAHDHRRPPSERSATRATTASRWSRPRATSTPTSASRPPTTPARTTRRHAQHRAPSTTPASRAHRGPTASSTSARSGPTTRKAYYSNYGVEQTDVAAPGGDFREFYGTPQNATAATRSCRPYPKSRGARNGRHRRRRHPTTPLVVKDCSGGVVRVLPVPAGHVDGRAARGRRRGADRQPVRQARSQQGGLTLRPARCEKIMERTATDHAVPDAAAVAHYPDPVSGPSRRVLRGRRQGQRLLRRRHRRRPGGRQPRAGLAGCGSIRWRGRTSSPPDRRASTVTRQPSRGTSTMPRRPVFSARRLAGASS